MEKNESAINAASSLGATAFHDGRSCDPIEDTELLKIIGQNCNNKTGDSIPLVDAWTAAWHVANLATVERATPIRPDQPQPKMKPMEKNESAINNNADYTSGDSLFPLGVFIELEDTVSAIEDHLDPWTTIDHAGDWDFCRLEIRRRRDGRRGRDGSQSWDIEWNCEYGDGGQTRQSWTSNDKVAAGKNEEEPPDISDTPIHVAREMEHAPNPWRNDRLPTMDDADEKSCAWVWHGRTNKSSLSHIKYVSGGEYWCPTNRPSVPPPVPKTMAELDYDAILDLLSEGDCSRYRQMQNLLAWERKRAAETK